MSKKPKHRNRVGGWPRRTASDPMGSRPPTPRELRPRPRDPERRPAALLRGLDAVRQLMEAQGTGALSAEEFGRRVQRFRELLMTDRRLLRIRPEWNRVVDAIKEFPEADPATQDEEEQRRKMTAYMTGRVLDRDLLEELRRALMDGLLRSRSTADADAMALALMMTAEALQDSPPSGDNPLAQILVQAMLAETHEMEQAVQGIGWLESALENPSAAFQAMEDPKALAKLEKALATNPAIRRHGERAARQAERRLMDAVRSGAIEAHLTADVLVPVLEGLVEFAKAHDTRHKDLMEDPALREDFQEIFSRFAGDPRNHAAFERFTAEFDAQVREARATEAPNALELYVLCQLWTSAWPNDEFLRELVVRASVGRVVRAAGEDEGTEGEEIEEDEMEDEGEDDRDTPGEEPPSPSDSEEPPPVA